MYNFSPDFSSAFFDSLRVYVPVHNFVNLPSCVSPQSGDRLHLIRPSTGELFPTTGAKKHFISHPLLEREYIIKTTYVPNKGFYLEFVLTSAILTQIEKGDVISYLSGITFSRVRHFFAFLEQFGYFITSFDGVFCNDIDVTIDYRTASNMGVPLFLEYLRPILDSQKSPSIREPLRLFSGADKLPTGLQLLGRKNTAVSGFFLKVYDKEKQARKNGYLAKWADIFRDMARIEVTFKNGAQIRHCLNGIFSPQMLNPSTAALLFSHAWKTNFPLPSTVEKQEEKPLTGRALWSFELLRFLQFVDEQGDSRIFFDAVSFLERKLSGANLTRFRQFVDENFLRNL